jgi:hypothetical protein
MSGIYINTIINRRVFSPAGHFLNTWVIRPIHWLRILCTVELFVTWKFKNDLTNCMLHIVIIMSHANIHTMSYFIMRFNINIFVYIQQLIRDACFISSVLYNISLTRFISDARIWHLYPFRKCYELNMNVLCFGIWVKKEAWLSRKWKSAEWELENISAPQPRSKRI